MWLDTIIPPPEGGASPETSTSPPSIRHAMEHQVLVHQRPQRSRFLDKWCDSSAHGSMTKVAVNSVVSLKAARRLRIMIYP